MLVLLDAPNMPVIPAVKLLDFIGCHETARLRRTPGPILGLVTVVFVKRMVGISLLTMNSRARRMTLRVGEIDTGSFATRLRARCAASKELQVAVMLLVVLANGCRCGHRQSGCHHAKRVASYPCSAVQHCQCGYCGGLPVGQGYDDWMCCGALPSTDVLLATQRSLGRSTEQIFSEQISTKQMDPPLPEVDSRLPELIPSVPLELEADQSLNEDNVSDKRQIAMQEPIEWDNEPSDNLADSKQPPVVEPLMDAASSPPAKPPRSISTQAAPVQPAGFSSSAASSNSDVASAADAPVLQTKMQKRRSEALESTETDWVVLFKAICSSNDAEVRED